MDFSSVIDPVVKTASKKSAEAKGKRLKGNVFIVTINSNKSARCISCTEAQISEITMHFESLAKKMYSRENLPKIMTNLKWPAKGAKPEELPLDVSNVKSLKAKTQIEIAPVNGFVHMHTAISIEYVEMQGVRMNVPLIKKIAYTVLADVLSVNGKPGKPYVQVEGARNVSSAMMGYVS